MMIYFDPKQAWREKKCSFYDYLSIEPHLGRFNRSQALRSIFSRYARAKKILFKEDIEFFILKVKKRDIGNGSVISSIEHNSLIIAEKIGRLTYLFCFNDRDFIKKELKDKRKMVMKAVELAAKSKEHYQRRSLIWG